MLSVLRHSCTDEPPMRTIREGETRQVATPGSYKDALAKDAKIARAVGHRVMVVEGNAFPTAYRGGDA